jgi:hypothetical protein
MVSADFFRFGRIPAQARGRAIRYYENAMRFHTAPIPCAALLFMLAPAFGKWGCSKTSVLEQQPLKIAVS